MWGETGPRSSSTNFDATHNWACLEIDAAERRKLRLFAEILDTQSYRLAASTRLFTRAPDFVNARFR
jgi:hypothetical protein